MDRRRRLAAIAMFVVPGVFLGASNGATAATKTTKKKVVTTKKRVVTTKKASAPTTAAPVTAAAPTTAAKPTFNPVNLNIAVSGTSIANDIVFQAVNGGWLQKYGINAKIIVAENSAVAMAAVISGDAKFMSGSRSEAINAQARGQDVVYVMKHSAGFLSNVVITNDLARTFRGDLLSLTLRERLRALDGATIAQPAAASVLTKVLDLALAGVGAKPKNTFISLPAMPAALQTNRVDAFMAPAPYPEQAVLTGQGVLFIKGNELAESGGPDIVQAPLMARRAYVDQNRDVTVRVIAAFLDAAQNVKDNEAAAKKITRARLSTIDESTFNEIWKNSYESLIRPLTAPMKAEEIAFMIKTDASDVAAAQNLDPNKLLVSADFLTDAKALQARMK